MAPLSGVAETSADVRTEGMLRAALRWLLDERSPSGDAEMPATEEPPQGRTDRRTNVERQWTSASGVLGFGIAERTTCDRLSADLALKVYVHRKLPAARLGAALVPRLLVPPWGGTIATDVEAIGTMAPASAAQATQRGRYVRPIHAGVAIGADDFSQGTLACIVERAWRGEARLHLLSNSHVIAASGAAALGHAIFQPSRLEGARDPEDRIARLAAAAPIGFSPDGWPNLVDAAVGVIEPGIEVDLRIPSSGKPLERINTAPRRGMRVRKIGKASGVTASTVRDIDFRVALPYRDARGMPVRAGFREQILCDPFTLDGDSGALVVDDRDAAVGLHVAASERGSVFCRIAHVFAVLDLALPAAGIPPR